MLKLFLTPILGGVIGYITNDLALKMLFHPHKALYIGKWHVPFTPGLIPSQKGRIAKSLGSVISSQLLSPEVIRREALSPEAEERLRKSLIEWLEREASEEASLGDKLSASLPAGELDAMGKRLLDDGSAFLLDKLLAAHPGELIADQVIEELRDKLRASPLSMLLDPAMLGVIRIKLAAMIDRRIAEKGPKLLRNKLEGLGSDILNRPLRETAEPFRSRIPELADKLLLLFRHVLENNLESLLRAARIDQIVERRIASFDAAQLEQLIFGIMKRELRAIVYLGAALGFLMGFINLLL